ncbi:CPSF A subunit region-domain-containing protein [Scheffersomyces xylosifermentans]|uniref:CPSF A subunit region-domain-containing protein n=1 Tax=Scheffersomyces xylosifermentans TaxID=1304137 RepID=UPI00315CB56D
MLVDNDTLYLYNLTLKPPSHYVSSVLGSFLGKKKSQEILVASSTSIALLRPDAETGKFEQLSRQNSLGVIHKVDKLRLAGTQKDLAVVIGNSGKLVLLEYNTTSNTFVPVLQQPYGKTGFGRVSASEYLCIDPQNRCIFIGALERNKLIYKVETNKEGNVELSSPLEAHSKQIFTLSVAALDTEYDNPVFAAIECDYSQYSTDEGDSSNIKTYDPESSPLLLNYYELDQGLNHIVKKKSSEKLPASSNHLIALPGHIGGVLVCCKNFILYDNLDPSMNRLYLPLPIRSGQQKTVIVTHVVHKLKKNNFFVLLQSSLGDLFKLTVDYNSDKELIDDIKISYFDTIPVCISINILKSGFLFGNVLNNDKLYYQFEKLGDDDDESALKASDYLDIASIEEEKATESKREFEVKGLDNLALVEIVETLSPIVDAALVETVSSESSDPLKSVVALSSHAYIKSLVHGIQTSTIVESPLPFTPTDVHTTKLFEDSVSDEYLVISSKLSSTTLVLSIGEVVEEVEESRFVTDQPTLAVQQVGKSSVIQVYTNGIRHIKHTRQDENIDKRTTDWFPPAGISIVKASTHKEQVIIGLSNAEICYFEIDPTDDQLVEYQDRVEMSSSITSLAISRDTLSKRKNSFAVVGCSDETIQVLSLQSHNCLETLSLQALSANSTSLVMLPTPSSTLVHIGMDNGLYVRTSIDEISGNLSDTRIKYLGSKPVSLSVIGLPDNTKAVLAISSRPWIGYYNAGSYKVTPLLGVNVSQGASFASEDIGGEGVVAIAENSLVVFTIGKEDEGFDINQDLNVKKLRLRYTPKQMIVDNISDKDRGTVSNFIYTLQSEYGVKGPFSKSLLAHVAKQEGKSHEDNSVDQDYFDAFGYKKEKNAWASCVQVIDVKEQDIAQSIEFEDNESAISLAKLHFDSAKGNSEYLIVGVSTNRTFLPNHYDKSYLYCFKINKAKKSNKEHLEFLHKTDLDTQPTSMIAFNGKLLVGMGKYLRLYDLGQRQLLRKSSSNIDYLTSIVKLLHQGGDRIVIGDASNSTTFAKFDALENRFISFADDIMKRQVTAISSLDYDTVIGGDKFGNIFVSRVSESVSKSSDEDWNLLKHQEPYLNASISRSKNVCEFFLSDTPTSFTRGSLTVGGQESIIYTGIQGTVGLLVPLSTKQEVEFLQKLELTLRKYLNYNFDDFEKDKYGVNLLGMDHLKFRSYYNPVKNVIDGDLVEQYYALTQSLKIKVARELNRTPREVERKISDLRERSAF